MKVKSLPIIAWTSRDLDIDWPRVQKALGPEAVSWVLKQDLQDCEFVLEAKRSQRRLILEFYSEDVWQQFALGYASSLDLVGV